MQLLRPCLLVLHLATPFIFLCCSLPPTISQVSRGTSLITLWFFIWRLSLEFLPRQSDYCCIFRVLSVEFHLVQQFHFCARYLLPPLLLSNSLVIRIPSLGSSGFFFVVLTYCFFSSFSVYSSYSDIPTSHLVILLYYCCSVHTGCPVLLYAMDTQLPSFSYFCPFLRSFR